MADLLQIVTDFDESGWETIKRIWRYDQPAGLMVEGLRKAGMELI